MEFRESENLELKKSTSELKEAIISVACILNKHQKGELFSGIKNDGTIAGQNLSGADCILVEFQGNNMPYYAYGRAYMRVGDDDRQSSAKELENLILRKNKDLKYYEGDLFYLIERAEDYILNNIHIGMRLEGLQRVDVPDINKEAFREAIIKRRNELIAEIFNKVHFVEKWGQGIELILSKEPETTFKEIADMFLAVFKRKGVEMDTVRDTEKVGEKLTKNQIKNIDFIHKEPTISAKELSRLLGISQRKIEDNLSKLKKKGLLWRIGADRGGRWEVMGG